MGQNLVINGVTYNGVESISFLNDKGEKVSYILQVETSYTNVIKTSIGADGNIYNGKGYKENTRWSSSSNAEKEYGGISITGYIPVKWNDIIRFKNLNFKDGIAETYVHYFADIGSWTFRRAPSECSNIKVDSDGNLIEFTSDYTGYLRVACSGIDETSIITINEPIE